MRSWRETQPAVIQLTGESEPDLFAGLDQQLVARADPNDARALYLPLVMERLVNWLIVSAPNPGWAEVVLGEPDLERLWDAIATTMRLDEDDPVAAWQEHAAMLKARAASLDARRFDAIRFRGPGTDLVVGLLEASRWLCATFETRSGIEHLPNLPTEEVFTTPDWRRTEGTVQSTYPLIVPGIGARVEGLRIRFEARPDRGRRGRRRRRRRDPDAAEARRPRAVSRRDRARGRLLACPADRARLPQHALRRERRLPHRVRERPADGGRRSRRRHRGRRCSSVGSTSRACTPTS